jgi:hypothetical protein
MRSIAAASCSSSDCEGTPLNPYMARNQSQRFYQYVTVYLLGCAGLYTWMWFHQLLFLMAAIAAAAAAAAADALPVMSYLAGALGYS